MIRSIQVIVQDRFIRSLPEQLNKEISWLESKGYEILSVDKITGEEWDYPKYRPTTGYNIIYKIPLKNDQPRTEIQSKLTSKYRLLKNYRLENGGNKND